MSNPNPNQATRFQKSGKPTLAKKMIGVRLSPEIDDKVRAIAGDELCNWVRKAIAEKLERDFDQSA